MKEKCPVCKNEISKNSPVCPECGFQRISHTQSFTPISLDAQSGVGSDYGADKTTQASFKILNGQQKGSMLPISETPLTIGRDPKNKIFLNDMTVSRIHASIDYSDGQYVLKDENSYNGTWYNNNSISSHILRDGDIVQFGVFLLRFQS